MDSNRFPVKQSDSRMRIGKKNGLPCHATDGTLRTVYAEGLWAPSRAPCG